MENEKENNVLLLLRRIDVYREALEMQRSYNRILESKIAEIRRIVYPLERVEGMH